jgi:hypothetical protein
VACDSQPKSVGTLPQQLEIMVTTALISVQYNMFQRTRVIVLLDYLMTLTPDTDASFRAGNVLA